MYLHVHSKHAKKITHHRGVAQPGSAPALGAGSRRFKSSRPDQPSLQNEVEKAKAAAPKPAAKAGTINL